MANESREPPDDSAPDSERPRMTKPRAPRKNLLLSATIEAGSLKAPVRIRNLSESGAMIEGAALPDLGSTLILRRSEVEIGARVVWLTGGRCGIQFDGTASIEEWVGGVLQARRPGAGGQARIDAIQAAIRSGVPLPAEAAPAQHMPVGPVRLNTRIAEELAYVKRLLDGVGDQLTEDPIMLQRHSQALQNFDVACQILGHLSVVLGAEDAAVAAESIPMEDLRTRLVRKALF